MSATKRVDEPHFVYEFRDPDGALLYVGISLSLGHRFAAHERIKPWWNRVADVRATQYPSKAEAERVEAATIADLSPMFNIAGHPFRAERQKYGWSVQSLIPRDPKPADELLDLVEMAAWMRYNAGTTKGYYRRGELPEPDVWRDKTPLWRVATIDLWDAARKGLTSDVG